MPGGGRTTREEALKRAEKLPEIVERYKKDEDVPSLAREFGIPPNTIWRYLKDMGVTPERKREHVKLKEITDKTEMALSTEAEKIATWAIGIGGWIARRHVALIDYMLSSKGLTLEQIAESIMDWYEAKEATEQEIVKLRADLAEVVQKLEHANQRADPNWRFALRMKALERVYTTLMRARFMGLRLSTHSILRRYERDVERISALTSTRAQEEVISLGVD